LRRPTLLLVIGDTHYSTGTKYPVATYAALANQLAVWAALFDEVLLAGVVVDDRPVDFADVPAPNVRVVALAPAGGSGLRHKVGIVWAMGSWIRLLLPLVVRADAVHVRCPCNVGLLAGPLARLAVRRRYAMYAGSWEGYRGEPVSYRLQRWFLSRGFGGIVHAYVPDPGDPGDPGEDARVSHGNRTGARDAPNVRPNFSPSFDDASLARERRSIEDRRRELARHDGFGPCVELVCVGRFSQNKNQRLLIDACAELVRRRVPIALTLVGDGVLRAACEDHVDALGLNRVVTMTGALSWPETMEMLRRSDIAVLASSTEGYPKVLLEAMSVGTVVVCSEGRMNHAMLGAGERGRVFALRDVTALADAIESVADERGDRLGLMAESCLRYAQGHTLERWAELIAGIVRDDWRLPRANPDAAPDNRPGVAQVIDALDLGGAERMAVDIANLLDPALYRSHLVATRRSGPMAESLRASVTFEVLGRRWRWDPRGLVRLRRFVLDHRIEVLHSHGRSSAQLVALGQALRIVRARHVFHDHYGSVHSDPRPPYALRAAARVGVDRYVGVDRSLCDMASQGLRLPPERVALVHNGVDLEAFDDAIALDLHDLYDVPKDRLVAVHLANLRESKDHETLIGALSSMQHADAFKVIVIGGDNDQGRRLRLERLIDLHGVRASIALVGAHTDAAAHLLGADFGILSSRSESGPLAAAEYLAAGLPYVVTDTGEIVKRLAGTDSGFVVPPGDVRRLAEALDRMVSLSPDERTGMGQRGRRLVETSFDQRAVVRSIERVYDALDLT
jgi:glycosyltransferase involved in cell wall biosynthesis